jgi:hypothetical protein
MLKLISQNLDKQRWQKILQFLKWTQKGKGLIQGLSAKRMKEVLKLNTNQLQWVVGLFTGQCQLKEHIFRLKLTITSSAKSAQKWSISHTYPVWLWGYRLSKSSSPGSLLYGTNWLSWCPHKKNPVLHSYGRIGKRINQKGDHNISWRLLCNGWINLGPNLIYI